MTKILKTRIQKALSLLAAAAILSGSLLAFSGCDASKPATGNVSDKASSDITEADTDDKERESVETLLEILTNTDNDVLDKDDVISEEEKDQRAKRLQSVKELNVVYPELLPFPSYDDYSDYNEYSLLCQEWQKQRSDRLQSAKELCDHYDFYKKTTTEFLRGSEGKNVVYSPLNFYMALTMLCETASGDTQNEILSLLDMDDAASVQDDSALMWYTHYRDDVTTSSILANSVWLNDKVDFNNDKVKTLAEKYFAECFKVDVTDESSNKLLQDWLNEKTGDLLKDAAEKSEFSPDTIMSLYSTLYFKARWEDEFYPQYNVTKTFHAPSGDIDTEFMYNIMEYGTYYFGNDFGAVSKRFSHGGSMWFILPDEDKTVDDVIASGEYMDMLCRQSKADYTTGDLGWENQKQLQIKFYTPKFDVSSDIDLTDSMKKLGVTSAFDINKADFSELVNSDIPVFLSKIRHAARVVIDEEGCTAAAFTEEMMCGVTMPPEEEMDFVLDRPFIFVIMSDADQPMFVGVVNEPV